MELYRKAYAYARIRARKSKLLFYRLKELKRKSYEELVLLLQQIGYIKILPEEVYSLEAVERELLRNLAEDFGIILKFIPRSAKSVFLTYYEKLNIHNAKTLLRIKLTKKRELFAYIVPTLEISKKEIEEVSLRDIERGVEQLIEKYKYKKYYSLLKEDVKNYEDLIKKELELDKIFLEILLSNKETGDIGRKLIDLFNIRVRLSGLNIFVKGGYLKEKDIPDRIPWEKSPAADLYPFLSKVSSIDEFEDKAREYLINLAEKGFLYGWFSPKPFVSYAILKEAEIEILRKLLVLKYYQAF